MAEANPMQAIAPWRTHLMPKVWFALYNVGAVFLLPYINLFYRHLGFTETQIGVLAALKPWVSAPAGNLIVSLADTRRAHMLVTVAMYFVMFLGRGIIPLVTGFGAQVFLALLTEAAASPLGALVDAAVMAASTDEGGYGRQRMWASIGWGGTSPLAGAVVARCGLEFAFAVYFVVCVIVLVPTFLLPIGILSSPKAGAGSEAAPSSATSRASSKLGTALSAGRDRKVLVQPSRGIATQQLAAPHEKRVRMDSNLASRDGSKQSLLAAAAGAAPGKGGGGGEGQLGWSIGMWADGYSSGGKQGEEQLPYGVLHLTADARSPTEQLGAMEGGQAPGSEAAGGMPGARLEPSATLSPSQVSAGGSRASSPLLKGAAAAAALTDDISSELKPCCSKCADGHGPCCNEDTHGTVLQGVLCMLRDIKVTTFFFLAFCMGIGNGCIGFLFLYLDELGATASLMGLCLSFNCLAEVPVFYYSGPIIERLGVERAFNLAMAGYVLRLLAYLALPLLPSVRWVLPVELLQGLTFALAWSAGCVYVKRVAPLWLRSTTQSIFQGLYAGLGSGLGGLVGGVLYGMFGAHVVFQAAVLTLLFGLAAATLAGRLAAGQGQRGHQGYTQVVGAGEDEDTQSG